MKACDFCGAPCAGVPVTVLVRSVVAGESSLSRGYAKTACRPECAENTVDLGLHADVIAGRKAFEVLRERELAAAREALAAAREALRELTESGSGPGFPIVHELRGPIGNLLAWLQARPSYCDRGRFHGVVEVAHWRSECDVWPRYYFNLARGKAELEAYLTAKGVPLDGAAWVARAGEEFRPEPVPGSGPKADA